MARPILKAPLVAKRKPVKLAPTKMRLMLDSGAYSAWRSGKPVDLEAYCDFLHENEEWIEVYVNLDHIIPSDPAEAARLGFKNLRYMQKRGLKPMAVYHGREDPSWLHRTLDTGCDYICLATSSMRSQQRAWDWYHSTWDHLVDSKGKPLVKVHALGDTRLTNLKAFPWKSSDSASWIYGAQRSGRMQTEAGMISHRKDKLHQKGAPDIEMIGGEDRAELEAIFRDLGVDLKGFDSREEDGWVMRSYVSMIYFRKLRDKVREAKRRHLTRGFFSPAPSDKPGINVEFDIYLVAGNNHGAYSCLAKGGYDSFLSSFFYIDKVASEQIKSFVLDPVGTVSGGSEDRFVRAWNILNKYVTES